MLILKNLCTKFCCFYFAEIRRRCAKCNFHKNVNFNVKTREDKSFKNQPSVFSPKKMFSKIILFCSKSTKRNLSHLYVFGTTIQYYKWLPGSHDGASLN